MRRRVTCLFACGPLGLLLALWPLAAGAVDRGQYEHVPQHIRDWFKSVRGANGIPCCDISDGHRTDYEQRADGFWVPIDGVWTRIPDEVVIHNAGNPTGDAVVWYTRYADKIFIRCFVPGNGV